MKNTKLNLNKDKIIKDYLSGKSTIEISKDFNVCDSSIGRLLKKYEIPIREMSIAKRIYQINENYFDNIDSEIKAYILGLFYADGYNNTKRNCVRISLHKKDIDIIEKIRKELFPNNDKPIGFSRKKNCDDLRYLDITNKHISKTLNDLGFTQGKTFKIIFPQWLSNDLYKHFIRGYFDGDGCLTYFINEKMTIKPKFEIIGTEDFCVDISNILGYKGYTKNVGNKNIVRWQLSGRKQILNVCTFLYTDVNIFMKRKYDKFEFIKNYKRIKK